jgi:hypothetical protein
MALALGKMYFPVPGWVEVTPDEGGLGVIFSQGPRIWSEGRMRTDRRLTDEECWRLLLHLFLRGLEDPLLLQELAPDGWEQSPLRLVFHPTVDQM